MGRLDMSVLQEERLMTPVQKAETQTPYFPFFLLIAESESHYLLPIPTEYFIDQDPQIILQGVVEGWKEEKLCPKKIRCRDERTFALLKDFCDKTGIKIIKYDGYMSSLQNAEENLLDMQSSDIDPNYLKSLYN